jgi:hypothetical protein
MQPSQAEPFRPVITPPPKTPRSAAKTPADSAGPPWAPAPEPERIIGPLPAVANSALPPDPGPGIRVPGDMAALPAVPPDAVLPAPFDPGASPDPDFPPRPPAGDEAGPSGRPARQSLGFAAAPVPADYAPPQAPDFTVPSRAAGLVLSAGTRPSAPADPPGAPAPPGPEGPGGAAGPADPSYIWDLAATDVFPAADVPGPPTETPGPVPEDGEPGASGR